MAETYDGSVRYITDFLKWLTPDAGVQQLSEFTFRIDLHNERMDVRFEQSEIEDFEVALERFPNTNYFFTLENRIRFRFSMSLGTKGLIPDFQISSELLREKGEWLKSIRTDVAFDSEFCAILYRGLTILSRSMTKTLASGLMLPEIEAEKETVENLRRFYEDEGHLTTREAEMESLSYLKAAALCMIMEKRELGKRLIYQGSEKLSMVRSTR